MPGEVVYEWVNGVKFFVRPGERGLTGNIYTGLHEFQDMAFILHYADASDLFVDVGANAGSYTLLACGAKGARGYAFEPVPTTFNRLSENLRLNQLENRVRAMNIGIGAKHGNLKFTVMEDCVNHVATGDDREETVVVKVETLDKILAREKPTIMKIDVEGYEVPVLKGAKNILRKPSLSIVLLETNGSGKRYDFEDKMIISLLVKNRFSAYSYNPFYRKLRDLKGKYPKQGNTLFVRNAGSVEKKIGKAKSIELFGKKI